jgi:hypothetical protein
MPEQLYRDLHSLHAPEAEAIRRKHGMGTSGATLTLAECERLYELEGEQLVATAADGLVRLRSAVAHFEWLKAKKKKKGKRRRRK